MISSLLSHGHDEVSHPVRQANLILRALRFGAERSSFILLHILLLPRRVCRSLDVPSPLLCD